MERFKGEITVFLSLILSMVLLLTLSLTELARAALIEAQIARDCENAMTSALAEYNRPLLASYNIFVMDGAYGRKSFNSKKIADRMKEYMAGLSGDAGIALGYGAEKLSVDNFRFVTDNCGEEIFDQAVSYMKKRFGLDLVSSVVGIAANAEKFDSEKDGFEEKKGLSLGESRPSGDNVFSDIDSLKDEGVLGLILSAGESVSDKVFDTKRFLSSRRKDLFSDTSFPSKSAVDRVLFDEYLIKSFKCYGTEESDYELEYILGGKESDRANLAEVAEKLALYREVMNFTYLQTDVTRKSEAAAMATGLLAITGNPAIIKAGEEIILAAWAYAESICDVRTLLKGGKIPVMKDSSNWHTGIESIATPGLTGTNDCQTGLDYQSYLRIMLFLEKDADKTLRAMDLMELEVRKTQYYESFALDNCISGFGISGNFRLKHIFGGLGNSRFDYGGAISYEMLENR